MGFQRSIGEVVSEQLGLAPVTATAGGSGDNTDEPGPLIDRQNYLSLTFGVALACSITTAKQSTVTARIQHTTDSTGATGWADFGTAPAALVLLHANTSGFIDGGNYDLSGANRYIRLVVKAVHTATGTDTTTMAGVVTLGGPNEPPV